MIKSLRIQNLRCFQDCEVPLGPLTVLVGTNGSGKTTFLQAVQLLSKCSPGMEVKLDSKLLNEMGLELGGSLVWRNSEETPAELPIVLRATCHLSDETTPEPREFGLEATIGPGDFGAIRAQFVDPHDESEGRAPRSAARSQGWARRATRPVQYYRLDPRALKEPVELDPSRPDSSRVLGPQGHGFSTFLLNSLAADRATFFEFETEFYKRFPEFGKLRIDPPGSRKHGLAFKTIHGEVFPASGASDGAMLGLAFLAIAHQPDAPRILLVEEPENGVHFNKLREIMDTLRAVTTDKGIQVIVTTHSPYLLDLVEPEEVRLFSKDPEGAVHAVRMADIPDMDSMRKHFMTGEIWATLLEQGLVKSATGQ